VQFLAKRGFPIPSPALIGKIGDRFRESVRTFASSNHIPVVKFGKHDRKITVMTTHLRRQAATGRSGVAAIGVAQEFQRVATCSTTPARSGGAPHFGWGRADRRVTCFYFYVWDADFGPVFIKICAYFPYPIKVCSTVITGPSSRPRRPVWRSHPCRRARTVSLPARIRSPCGPPAGPHSRGAHSRLKLGSTVNALATKGR